MSAESKAGAFFLLALVLLGYFSFKVEDVSKLWGRAYVIHGRFDHVRELKQNDPVAVAGVRVGKVRGMRLVDGHVLVSMEIDEGVRLSEGAVARIQPSGLLGTKYVDISFPPEPGKALRDGDEILTAEGIDVGLVLDRINEAVKEVGTMFDTETKEGISGLIRNLAKVSEDLAEGRGTVGKLIASDELYKKADSLVDELVGVGTDLRRIVGENEEDIRAIVQELREAAPRARAALEGAEKLVAGIQEGKGLLPRLLDDEELYHDFRSTLAGLKEFAANLEEGKGLAQRLLSDEKMADDAAAAIASFREAGDGVRVAFDDIRAFMSKLQEGEGTIQLLLTDRALYDDARRLVDRAEDALRSMKEQIPVGTFTGLLISAF